MNGPQLRAVTKIVLALSTGFFELIVELTWANGRTAASSAFVAFTVVTRCPPLDLVRLWCSTAGSPQLVRSTRRRWPKGRR